MNEFGYIDEFGCIEDLRYVEEHIKNLHLCRKNLSTSTNRKNGKTSTRSTSDRRERKLMKRICKFANKKNKLARHGFVYVLSLQDACYYVGWTINVQRRLQSHWCGNGANWTRLHKPISVVQVSTGTTDDENIITKEMVMRYGLDAVRGGHYCQCDKSYPIPVEFCPYGKHKGKPFLDIQSDYLQWLLTIKELPEKWSNHIELLLEARHQLAWYHERMHQPLQID